MNEIRATFRIVTPMFIGGANQNPDNGIRLPSIKGALRFWWRALNWGRFLEEGGENEVLALKELHREECRLFGSSKEGNSGGQGCFLLSIVASDLEISKKDSQHREFSKFDAARYLGYGLIEAFSSQNTGVKAGELTRSCIDEDQPFTIKLRFKQDIEETVKEALIALGLLGGLGSRSRHGLGSINLEELKEGNEITFFRPVNKSKYLEKVKLLLKEKLSAKPPTPYTAFDSKSRVELLCTSSTPYKTLNDFAHALLMYRSAGRGKKVLGQNSEENFPQDHDWKYRNNKQHKKKWLTGNLPDDFHPKRVVFGLPHNYGKTADLSVKPENLERRASPLFIHIHQISEKEFVCISIFLPTIFLPKGESINAGGDIVSCNANYDVITEFLDGTNGQGTPRFPHKELISSGVDA